MLATILVVLAMAGLANATVFLEEDFDGAEWTGISTVTGNNGWEYWTGGPAGRPRGIKIPIILDTISGNDGDDTIEGGRLTSTTSSDAPCRSATEIADPRDPGLNRKGTHVTDRRSPRTVSSRCG